ncbi:hypothetical protein G6011_00166 [Alternaria panax]|uniref:Uncharacterized protein n=1 Tax=Alternaria panax TaxID=48097 RepID=A0AAD4IIK1_9PLEO|nr:hypothetical protein G6011_00166 [Alternaria panax]
MKKLLFASLLASAIDAQYNLTYLHLMWEMEPTLTLMGSDETATTYEKICPETTTPAPSSTEDMWPATAGESALSASFNSMMSAALSFYRTGLPVETPTSEPEGCTPFTMLQGPETWEFHLAAPGVQTRNGACTWTGVFSEVPITCDAEAIAESFTIPSGSPTVFSQSELRAWTSPRYAIATIVEATPALTSTPTPASTGDASGARGTGTEPTGSEGRAPGASLPTAVMLMVGAAAAVGGAAWVF